MRTAASTRIRRSYCTGARNQEHETTKPEHTKPRKRAETRYPMRREDFTMRPIGVIRSTLIERKGAPRQGAEGAPDAWLEVESEFADALLGVAAGDELLVFT